MNKKIVNDIKPRNNQMIGSKEDSIFLLKSKNRIFFTFEDFRVKPINIEKEFNNHFEDQNDYINRMNKLMEFLNMFSSYRIEDLHSGGGLKKQLHFHRVDKNIETVEKILTTYGFNEEKIESIISGNRLYQISLEAKRSSIRVIVEWTENIFSILFLDTNHHIYMNEKLTKNENTLFYNYCPKYEEDECESIKYMDECYAFEYLDHEKIRKTYGYSYSPNEDKKSS